MTDSIIRQARKLARDSGTTDPFRIARGVGAEVHYADLGSLKGMYAIIQRHRFIVVSNQIDRQLQRIVCAHELGHDRLHRDMAKDKWFHEFAVCNLKLRPEYEANLFASEILLPDDEILSLIEDGLGLEQLAQATYTDVNLVALKLNTLSDMGYRFRRFESRDNFLTG